MNLRILSLLFITIIFCHCKKTNSSNPSSSVQQVKRDHGQPTGLAVQQTIGAAGGTITSADGALTLTIPAGAVEANTNFSIQPVQNVLQSKAGAYRLQPETVFKKPVTITMSYTNVRPEEAAFLFPVYQDASGNFYQPKNIQHNATAKTLTVQTTHFSDWTFTSRVELHAEGSTELHGGDSVSFTLVKYLTDDKTTDAYQDGVPLMEDLGFAELAKITWTKTSATGGLNANNTKAKYIAPTVIHTDESLLVTATVEDMNLGKDNNGQVIRQIILSQPVTLVPDGGDFFELVEDGTTYRTTTPHFTLNGGYMTATGDFPSNRSITLTVRGGTGPGSFVYSEPGAVGKALINYTGDNSVYVSFRTDDCANPHDIHYSPGTFNVTKVATQIGEYSEGTFTGEIYAYDWCPSQKQKVVSGKFKVRKNY